MQPNFTTNPAFTVVELKYHGKNETRREIPQLWEQFNARVDEIQHRASTHNAYGVRPCGRAGGG